MSNDKLAATFHPDSSATEPYQPMSIWLAKQPEFKPGDRIPYQVGRMRAEDFNDLRAALNRPNLGLATTRELLEELRTRGDLEVTCYPGTERAHQGHVMSGTAMGLLDALKPEMLDYKTWQRDPNDG